MFNQEEFAGALKKFDAIIEAKQNKAVFLYKDGHKEIKRIFKYAIFWEDD